jgi:hypothetical protein
MFSSAHGIIKQGGHSAARNLSDGVRPLVCITCRGGAEHGSERAGTAGMPIIELDRRKYYLLGYTSPMLLYARQYLGVHISFVT